MHVARLIKGDTKLRKSLKLVALAGVAVASLLLAPTAHANGGDPAPTPPAPTAPKAACAVVGSVTTPYSPTQTVGHSDYVFVTTTITCAYNDGRVVEYDVNAAGDTWGAGPAGLCDPSASPPGSGGAGLCAGSSTLDSWSDNSRGSYSNPCGLADTTNMGYISASDGTGTAEGFVKFVRVGSETVAWGEFCTGSGQGVGDSFIANLEFTPQNPTGTYGPGDRVPYDLRGVATIND